ncbi:bifunctional protein [Kitasatospora indigofera]|uniref:Bifunctional protein n=1 Tax=Kitasatospora indigofera TaxID=67307 RepID=A0A919GE06_9ACTN|nr:alpha/beta fold hydrolase [Kitasatospora indigofera]GHH82701.1 bifunctional protein [Kitasatospora indigofera]
MPSPTNPTPTNPTPTNPMPNPTPNPTPPPAPTALVLGATGFIGRWLVLELLSSGRTVAAAVRGGRKRDGELRKWLGAHGADERGLLTVEADITRPGLGLSPADDAHLTTVRDVFNTAALYRFGLSRAEAHAANVDGALHALRWAATRPRLRRLVHISGYRVGTGPAVFPLPPHEADERYARLGAYEASKLEGDAAVRVEAVRLGVPLTVVNPSSVIGHSVTGEAGQYIGLASLVEQLWHGRLPALPGSRRTFLPVVAIDHLARFLAAVPEHDSGPLSVHAVLDPMTPDLPELVALVAAHLGVRAPRRLIPTTVLRRLPRALTRTDPETLSFISEDRYDTSSAEQLAEAAGIGHPPVEDLLRRWAARLVADRFGTAATGAEATSGEATGGEPIGAAAVGAAPGRPAGSFVGLAGSRSYVTGEREAPGYVLLHGLPFDSTGWHAVVDHLPAPSLLADLPGLGRSSPATGSTSQWLTDLLAPVRSRPVIVAHSAAAGPALAYATAHPERVSALVLVAPYFLQPRPRRAVRTVPITATVLRRASVGFLAGALLGPGPHSAEAEARVSAAVLGLRRPGVAGRTARRLRSLQRPLERSKLSELLRSCPVPVRLVVGEYDPLTLAVPANPAITLPAVTVPGAGHYPQLSHPDRLAEVLAELTNLTAPADPSATDPASTALTSTAQASTNLTSTNLTTSTDPRRPTRARPI